MTDTPSIPRPAQPCITCGTPTTNPKQRCTTHLKAHTKQHNQQRAYYHTTEWARLRAACLQRDHHQCVICSRTGPQLTAHHIVPRKQGGLDTLNNLTTLCSGARGSCHNRIENNDPSAHALLNEHLTLIGQHA